MQGPSPSDLLDIREAAALLRVSEVSLRRWTNAGRLPCLRIGGRRERRFRRSDLLAFLEGAGLAAPARTPANHFCGLYADERHRARAAARFLAPALRSGALALLVAAKDVQRAALAALKRDHGSLSRHLRGGGLQLAEYTDSTAKQLAYWEAQLRAAQGRGVTRMYIVADVTGGGLGRLPFSEVLKYEAEFGRSIAAHFPVMTLCQYDAHALSGLDIARLVECHHAALH